MLKTYQPTSCREIFLTAGHSGTRTENNYIQGNMVLLLFSRTLSFY